MPKGQRDGNADPGKGVFLEAGRVVVRRFAFDKDFHRDVFPSFRFLEGDGGAGFINFSEGKYMIGPPLQDPAHLPIGRGTRGGQFQSAREIQRCGRL